LAFGGLTKPQLGQPAASGEAHSMQNFAPTRFSVEQLGQIKDSRTIHRTEFPFPEA
jgi:hypothetical protein